MAAFGEARSRVAQAAIVTAFLTSGFLWSVGDSMVSFDVQGPCLCLCSPTASREAGLKNALPADTRRARTKWRIAQARTRVNERSSFLWTLRLCFTF